MNAQLTPARILETATAFWPSKALLSAIELGLFTELAQGKKTADELSAALGVHKKRALDLYDVLVAMGFVDREGTGPTATYSNTPETDLFLDRAKPSYAGGMPEMLNSRLFGFWGALTEALKTGEPQNETKSGGASVFEALYANEEGLESFLAAMSSVQMGNFLALAAKFDFSSHKKVIDVGGANAQLSRTLAAQHPHLSFCSFDLPPVAPVATREIEREGLSSRIHVIGGDFFKEELPQGDIITMGNVLHDWSEENKLTLIRKAYDALPEGGVFIVIENIIDDERRQNAFGMLMSLNMLIEFGADGGFDYTGADFDGWCKNVGFLRTEVLPLAGPSSAAIAYK